MNDFPAMNLFNFFFKVDKVQCPRCLGKGQVDKEDIKRFGNELYWAPGRCAYCLGKGTVSAKQSSLVDAGNPYLSLDLPKRERRKLFRGNKAAHERAKAYKLNYDHFIQEIIDLYVEENREPDQILRTISYRYGWPSADEKERKEVLEYINKVIEFIRSKR